MTGLVFFDAIDAGLAIWEALLAWIVAGAVVGTVVVLGSGVATVYAWRAVRSRCAPASRLRSPSGDSGAVATLPEASSGRTAARHSHTRTDRYEDAA